MSPNFIPLAVFAMIVAMVAIANVSRVRNLEVQAERKLRGQETEHRKKMWELALELHRTKQVS